MLIKIYSKEENILWWNRVVNFEGYWDINAGLLLARQTLDHTSKFLLSYFFSWDLMIFSWS
jgi:hypothetical protein